MKTIDDKVSRQNHCQDHASCGCLCVTCRLSDYSIVSPRVPDDAVSCVERRQGKESSVFQETKEHQQLKHDVSTVFVPFVLFQGNPRDCKSWIRTNSF